MTAPNQDPAMPVWQPSQEAASAGSTPGADAEATAAAPTAATAPDAATVSAAPAVAHVPARPRRANSTAILLVVAALVAVGGVAFAIGHATGGTAGSSSGGTVNDRNGFPGDGQFAPGGSFAPDGSFVPGDFGGRGGNGLGGSSLVTGTVTAISADSMTIQLASGQTVTVALDSSTSWHAQTSGSSTDVTTGSTVIVQTTTNASASASPGTGSSGTTRQATDVTVTSGN